MPTPVMNVRIEPELKERAAANLMKHGLFLSDYVRHALTYVAEHGELPAGLAMNEEQYAKFMQERSERAYRDRGPSRPVQDFINEERSRMRVKRIGRTESSSDADAVVGNDEDSARGEE